MSVTHRVLLVIENSETLDSKIRDAVADGLYNNESPHTIGNRIGKILINYTPQAANKTQAAQDIFVACCGQDDIDVDHIASYYIDKMLNR